MKKTLLILGLLAALGTAVVWAALGANRGWTKTSVPVKITDEITGIEAITYEKKFVPGVEFLGAGVLGGGFLAACSLLFRKKNLTTNSNHE